MTEVGNRNVMAAIEMLDFMGTHRTPEEHTCSRAKPHPQTQSANAKVATFEQSREYWVSTVDMVGCLPIEDDGLTLEEKGVDCGS